MSDDELIPVPITVMVRRSDLEEALARHTPQIDPKDLRVNIYSNGWDTAAVELLHLPTGLRASSSEHQSQLANRAAALDELRALLRGEQ